MQIKEEPGLKTDGWLKLFIKENYNILQLKHTSSEVSIVKIDKKLSVVDYDKNDFVDQVDISGVDRVNKSYIACSDA